MHRILRTLFWAVVVFAIAWVIASLSGRISVDVGPYTVETSDALAVTTLLALFLALYGLLRLVSLIPVRPPGRFVVARRTTAAGGRSGRNPCSGGARRR